LELITIKHFAEVQFFVYDELPGTDTYTFYNWVCFNAEQGKHSLKTEVKLPNDQVINSTPVTINIFEK